MNETTRHADVILPAPSALEEPAYELTFMVNAIRSFGKYDAPVFENEGPDEAEIFARLTLALAGQGANADPNLFHADLIDKAIGKLVGQHDLDREKIEAELEGLSPLLKQLDLKLRGGWQGDLSARAALAERVPSISDRWSSDFRATADGSGKFDLAAPHLVEDWARVRARLDAGPSEGLLLIGRRHLRSNNSWMHNVPSLVAGKSRCTLLMHPEDAASRGLETGARTEIKSRAGALEVEVEVSDAMMKGVVSLPHGWGHGTPGSRMRVASENAGVPSNVLTDDRVIDTASGNGVLNGIPVEVAAA